MPPWYERSDTKRNETKIVWVPWPGRVTVGCLYGPHDLSAGWRTEPGPGNRGKKEQTGRGTRRNL